MVAQGEQVALVQSGMVTVRFSPTVARLAAEAFKVGRREEWRRIGQPDANGCVGHGVNLQLQSTVHGHWCTAVGR